MNKVDEIYAAEVVLAVDACLKYHNLLLEAERLFEEIPVV